jgi:hypothetical protein
MVKPFPQTQIDPINKEDSNPAVRLYGRRYFVDQTSLEILVELLLVISSKKRNISNGIVVQYDTCFPPIKELVKKIDGSIEYSPKSRLNLKLFSFFGSSRIDSRHEVHREHLRYIDKILREKIRTGDKYDKTYSDRIIKTLENLFLGFHGVGSQRTWCAQNFIPICSELIGNEVIWNETYAKNNSPKNWENIINNYNKYFSVNKHRFLSRGGELLYLQICNAIRQKTNNISSLEWEEINSELTVEEQNPLWLYEQIESHLGKVLHETPTTIDKIARFIDSGIEEETAKITDQIDDGGRWVKSAWCPEETWPEGYLFAVELLRICRARLDIMTRLELLETACTLQVMRTLCAQASRYSKGTKTGNGAWPPYYWAISDPEGSDPASKRISRESIQASCKMIYDALRHPEILEATPSPPEPLYAEADRKYGHKLFLSLGKRIGMIVPRRGAGARFVLNERLLRFLVVALVPSRRITFDSFKERARGHFGIVFDSVSLEKANAWATGIKAETLSRESDEWLAEMLDESGSFRRLSDSCALVENLASDDGQGE